MNAIFWAAVALVAYTYFGYALGLWVRAKFRPQPVHSAPNQPTLSIVLVVHNEDLILREKLQNLLTISYPEQKVEIIVVSDGSTDDTNRILTEFAHVPRLRIILSRESRGKAAGLNSAIQAAVGEIVVFTDARQKIAPEAIGQLIENFADPSVGCASGELILGDADVGDTLKGMGLYWKTEKWIRSMESASGSVVGATGALYAVRRSLLQPIPQETILDDVVIPMRVVRQGYRVILDSRARVWDVPDLGRRREFARKVRTLSGVYQLLKLEPWLLSRNNPIRSQFISHKLLRLAVPFALSAGLLSSLLLSTLTYRVALVLQILFYSLSVCARLSMGPSPLAKLCDAAFTFVVLNVAALVAFVNFVAGRKPVWGR